MQFLTISRRRDSAGAPGALAEEESRTAQTLYSRGAIRQIWHRNDFPGACILWEAESEQQVRELMEQLPFARAELIEFSIIPLRPYAGFVINDEKMMASGPRSSNGLLPENATSGFDGATEESDRKLNQKLIDTVEGA